MATAIIIAGDHGFGSSMALSSSNLVVSSIGEAFMFKKNDAGDYPTTVTANITAYTGEQSFGYSMTLSSTHTAKHSALLLTKRAHRQELSG